MTRALFLSMVERVAGSLREANLISREAALDPALIGVPMYEEPMLGFARADDPLFEAMRREEAVGPHFRLPGDWLPEAKTVVSLFFPHSLEVRKSNRQEREWPSLGWVHARAEGMDMIDTFNEALREALRKAGHQAVSPVRMEQFFAREYEAERDYTSNWSERHVAYICGLGTFGLSKGLITKKGVAGRFTSIITDLELPADARDYEDIYEYCSLCGACAKNCPAGAISIEEGKDHVKCSRYVNKTIERFQPPDAPKRRNRRYGCGKCLVKVPCEAKPCKKKA